MNGPIEDAIQAIEAERDRLTAAINTLRALLPDSPPPRGMAGGRMVAMAPALARMVGADTNGKAPPAPKGKRAEKTAEIQRRLAGGESVSQVAKAMGLTPQTVCYHRGKGGKAPTKAKAEASPGVTFRCAVCGQKGHDPKRCDHCQEKR